MSPTPAALAALLAQYQLTAKQAAVMLGVHQRTVEKWLYHERAMPGTAWELLNLKLGLIGYARQATKQEQT